MACADQSDDVVLTGLSGRLPEVGSVDEFARQLFAGVDLVTVDDRRWTPGWYGLPERHGKLQNLTHFDAAFFGVHAKQAHVMDPQIRLLQEVAHETLVDAGYNPVEMRGSRTGVYVGVSISETEELLGADIDNITGYVATGCNLSVFANRISYAFDFKGPSLAINSACASSMYALAQAADDIRNNRCTAAVVAGTHICIKPQTSLNFQRLGMLSPEGRCASFDASASGYARSEAIVAVLLQRRCDARRVYCTVRGAGTNNDGWKTKSFTYPSGAMQRRLAEETFEQAHLRPQDVAYVEAHGTGTKAGDLEEVNAIAELFCKDRQTPLLLGSVKSNMGHAEPAAGLCGVAKVVVAMECGVIPGNLHFKSPNKKIPALNDGRIQVVDKNTAWQGGLVSVNSAGLGGSNAHVILEGGRGVRPPQASSLAPRLVLASGRTDKAVERLLKLAAEHPRDAELHALIDAVHARAIPRHPHRGYAILDSDRDAPPVFNVIACDPEPRPVWLVFTGMGSHTPGVARTLLRLPVFAASIARSAAALKPYGVDLHYVITDAACIDAIIDCFMLITAVQVALVDVLRELSVHPDGIIGVSCGEIGCAYADGVLTAEQAMLCAYWRGRSVMEAQVPPGAMAVVGLSWDEARRYCSTDIDCACYKSAESIVISGPPASVEIAIEKLAAEGVYTKFARTLSVAFHSKYCAAAAPRMHEELLKVIPEPKPRSARWLSSSVPKVQWDSDLARLSDATYFVNNFLSPVRFADVLERVPERALVLEIGPDAQNQVILKNALPRALHVPLLRRSAPDPLAHLLAAVGKAYAAGTQPQVARLYPAVTWPVSRGTPGLSSHVGWDHSVEWSVADFRTAGRVGEIIVQYDLGKPDDSFLAGHIIDGRTIFPAAAYLTVVWRSIAKMKNLKMEDTAVVLENIQFHRATIVSRDVPLQFHVSLLSGSSMFEICESGEVVATGTARLANDPITERLPTAALDDTKKTQENLPHLNSDDIYKELRLRGYNHKGMFCGIKSSDACATRGLVNWAGNWVTFIDTMIQFITLGEDKPGLYLPTRLQRAVIDPVAQRAAVSEGSVLIKSSRSIDVTVAGGVEIRGLKWSAVPRRVTVQASPVLHKFEFVPLNGACDTEARHALAALLQVALENCYVSKMRIAELALHRPAAELLLPYAKQVLETEPRVRVEATLAAAADLPLYADAMSRLGIKVTNKDMVGGMLHVALGADVVTRTDLLAALGASADFVLLEEPVRNQHETQTLLTTNGLELVSSGHSGTREYLLLRWPATVPAMKIVIEVRNDDFAWVEDLKDAMKRAETEDLRVYVWSREQDSGLQGLAVCLRREPGGERLRCYYLPGAEPFNPDAPTYRAQVQRDLAFNVLRGEWGTFRHLLLDDVTETKQVEHAYVNTLSRGNLSSLRWIESNLQFAGEMPRRPHTDVCRVYYSALNFRDVMVATGKLPLDALPGDLAAQECSLGLEFSGRSSTGKRVMGIVPSKGIATTVLADETLMWEVPQQWSLEEAATVPMAYATAYYALAVRGHMRRGESVLVHAGAGGVGLAAITIALHAGCHVFTTVSTPEKRAFLRERFPQLPDTNIGNSRDCSFEQLVLRSTRGRGVDLVLNSHAGDQLQASLHCLANDGRFLEIGKVDLSANTPLGMAVLLKNTSVYGIMLDSLFTYDHPEKAEVVRCVTDGITSGNVRPLPTTVYGDNQLEEAFRHMATGKHIGKVLIRVQSEAANAAAPAPARLLSAEPRVYMHPGKSYVLVGGLGGIGLELAGWLVQRGARTLVLNSRSGVRTGYQARRIRRWRESGVDVVVSTVDATSAVGARELLQAAAAHAPVGGVINLAAVMNNAMLENQSPEHFRDVAKPKINGTRALDAASRDLAPALDHFVFYSSMSAGRGERGMCPYGFANSGAERVCELRRADGLPAVAVQFGAVGDVGMVVNILGPEDTELSGTRSQSIWSCNDTLGALLAQPHAVAASTVLADTTRLNHSADLLHVVAGIFGIKEPDQVSKTATLAELGMDSIMGTEVKQVLERDYDVYLSASATRALTFHKLRNIQCNASE